MDDVSTGAKGFGLRRVFTDPHYAGYRYWHMIIMAFTIGSCIDLALESVRDLADNHAALFTWSEWSTVVMFTIDAVANVYFSPKPWRYVFSIWGLIDIISVVPSYFMLVNLTSLRSTKMLRLVRVVRALRVLKLARTAADGADVTQANPILANLKIYVIIFFAVFMLASTSMYYVEGSLYSPDAMQAGQAALDAAAPAGAHAGVFVPVDPISGSPIPAASRNFTSIPAAMWWCIETMTTTGYGDMYPVTVGGRIVAAITMLCGLILFGILLNIVNKTMMLLFFGENASE